MRSYTSGEITAAAGVTRSTQLTYITVVMGLFAGLSWKYDNPGFSSGSGAEMFLKTWMAGRDSCIIYTHGRFQFIEFVCPENVEFVQPCLTFTLLPVLGYI